MAGQVLSHIIEIQSSLNIPVEQLTARKQTNPLKNSYTRLHEGKMGVDSDFLSA